MHTLLAEANWRPLKTWSHKSQCTAHHFGEHTSATGVHFSTTSHQTHFCNCENENVITLMMNNVWTMHAGIMKSAGNKLQHVGALSCCVFQSIILICRLHSLRLHVLSWVEWEKSNLFKDWVGWFDHHYLHQLSASEKQFLNWPSSASQRNIFAVK